GACMPEAQGRGDHRRRSPPAHRMRERARARGAAGGRHLRGPLGRSGGALRPARPRHPGGVRAQRVRAVRGRRPGPAAGRWGCRVGRDLGRGCAGEGGRRHRLPHRDRRRLADHVRGLQPAGGGALRVRGGRAV
ncbi:MAG: hypothetical protein AVDCRST_MAG52-1088, partial [uncultured Blastococcus sp.]